MLKGYLQIHAECKESYTLSSVKKCVQCGEAVLAVAGKFSGRYYIVDEGKGDRVHAECNDAYESSR